MSEEELKKSLQNSKPVETTVDPFPGLRPFGIEESHLFFGREGQSDEVLRKLADNKFVGILGASGSGKSSLLYCGLIPTLYGGFMSKAGSDWKIVVTRPGGGPIDNLADALLQNDEQDEELDEEEKLIRKTITSTVLRSSSLGLIESVKQLNPDRKQNILILVDQFEELFRYKKLESQSSDLDESSAFVNLLLEAVHQYDMPIYVALTMRSDFIGDCAYYPELTQMINDSHYLIPQMTRDQKRLAIEGPVAVGGGKIAPRLTQQLLNDVGDNPDQLPILQHALMRTWQFWKEFGSDEPAMDIRHYNAIGTLNEALSQHANEAYDSLSKRQQQICEGMFKSLTERGTESSGIRRPTKVKTIAAIAGVTEEEVGQVVDKFREPGRTLLMPPYGVPLESDTVIDISHESLMRIWSRLKSWLDEESRSADMYLKLAESSERFQQGKASLWKMPDLQLALNWLEEANPTLVWGQRYDAAFERTMVFLETSKRAYETEQRNKELLQKRALKRSRIIAGVFGAASLVCIFLVIFSFIQAAEAQKAQQESLVQKEKAEEALVKAENQEKIAIEKAEEAIIAQNQAEAAQEQAEIEKQNAEAQRQKAILAQQEAEVSAEKARKSKLIADQNAEAAKKSAQDAERQRIEATKLRYQAVANSMAIKSQKIIPNNLTDTLNLELKGLIAIQAWKFDKDNNVKGYNPDVYSGVYYAYKDLINGQNALKEESDGFKYHYLGHDENFAVRSLVFSNDGQQLFSAGSDGKVISWDLHDENRTPLVLSDRKLKVNRIVQLSQEGERLAVGGDGSNIELYSVNGGMSIPKMLSGFGEIVFDLEFLPNQKGLLASSSDSTIYMSDFNRTTVFAKSDSRYKAITISNDGKSLAGGNNNGMVQLWNVETKTKIQDIDLGLNQEITALTYNQDASLLIMGTLAGRVFIYDMVQQKLLKSMNDHRAQVSDLEFSPDGKLLASTSFDGTAKLYVMSRLNDLPMSFDDHGDGIGNRNWVWSVAFAPDGQSMMTSAGDGVIRNWPIEPSEMISEMMKSPFIRKNLSENRWKAYVGEDIPYLETVKGLNKRED